MEAEYDADGLAGGGWDVGGAHADGWDAMYAEADDAAQLAAAQAARLAAGGDGAVWPPPVAGGVVAVWCPAISPAACSSIPAGTLPSVSKSPCRPLDASPCSPGVAGLCGSSTCAIGDPPPNRAASALARLWCLFQLIVCY